MDSIWIALIVGVLLGGIFSLTFGILSKKGADSLSRNIFGISSSTMVTNAIVFILAGAFVFLATLSAIIKDLGYPKAYPVNFTIETLLMAFMPAVVIFAMTNLRGYPISATTYTEFAVLVAKFGLLHILLQFSGFYSSVFPPK